MVIKYAFDSCHANETHTYIFISSPKKGYFSMIHPIFLILLYFFLINIVGFSIMGIDKHKAKKHLWRIPEKTLFMIAAIGGSLGSLCGMYLFRHKTKHKAFVLGMPFILVLHISILLFILYKQYM